MLSLKLSPDDTVHCTAHKNIFEFGLCSSYWIKKAVLFTASLMTSPWIVLSKIFCKMKSLKPKLLLLLLLF